MRVIQAAALMFDFPSDLFPAGFAFDLTNSPEFRLISTFRPLYGSMF
ncbi:hypothetical protein SCG7086_BM_00030 [Chlamydiales bacterium SCGC AG-110-P3]|nr:hypothetical protein SCG7086_BM_00030 [Chlamydiales bacterium SCGC AG-110-P3]